MKDSKKKTKNVKFITEIITKEFSLKFSKPIPIKIIGEIKGLLIMKEE